MYFWPWGSGTAGAAGAGDLGGVEVRGVVFGEDFAFGHFGGGKGGLEMSEMGMEMSTVQMLGEWWYRNIGCASMDEM